MTSKAARPAFQAVEKGIPTLVVPKPEAAEPTPVTNEQSAAPKPAATKPRGRAGGSVQTTPRGRMKTLNVEVPDYAWIEIKMRAAQQMVSVRHVIMSALKSDGIAINDADMIEYGRRLRGSEAIN